MIVAVMSTALAGSAWAQTTGKIEFGTNYVKINAASVTANDDQGNAWTITTVGTNSYTTNAAYYQVGSSKSPAQSITFTTTLSEDVNVTSFNAHFGGFNGTAGNIALTVDDTTVGEGSLNGTADIRVGSTSSATGKVLTVSVTNIEKGVKCYDITYTYETANPDDQSVATSVVINSSNITNTNVYDGTAAGTLTASVVAGEVTLSDADITWSGDNDAVATIDATTGVVTLVGAGNVTFKATYAGEEGSYKASFATYEMTVTNSDPNAPGTANKPYTVAEARAAIDAGVGVTGVYAKGIVSKIVTAYNSQYGNISYNISADGTEEADQLQAYRGKSYKGENFTSADDIQVGDTVVIYGNLKKYNTTYEFDADNQLVSLQRPVVTAPCIDVAETEVTVPAEGKEGTIVVDYLNISNVAAEVFFCDADGNAATYDWIVAEINSQNNNVDYIIDANTSSDARTAYFKVYALDDDANDVYSDLVTINQAGYVAPAAEFATLPFAFDGGKADIEAEDGLTQEGLDSDYNSSPKLKFNSTGDYVVLAFNERPGVLTFDIKGNSFSGGMFTVQTSEDGVTYTDLEAYTTLGAMQSEEFDNLGEDVRYIKWVYTEKSSGNVALGNIALAKYTEPVFVAAITVDPAEVSAPAEGQEGTITVTYENMDETNITSRQIVWYTDPTDEATMSPNAESWITADFDENQNVKYLIKANEGSEARTAYFKVLVVDAERNNVYSGLVTINQAGVVVDYATVPFAYNGGKSNLPTGFTQNGLGNDYSASTTKFKFDNTGDELIVKIDKAAAMLFFDIKGNNFSGGTFTVQTSADGTAYAELSSYTNLDDTQTEALQLDADVRYIKWVYTEKSSGNVGLGNIKVVDWVDEVTVGEAGYATYVAKHNESFPVGVEAYKAAVNGQYVTLTAVTAVPKGTPVVLKGEGTFTLIPTVADNLSDVTGNELKASDGTVEGNGSIYVLAQPAGEKVGFYAVEKGTKVAEGKAYLEVVGTTGVKAFYFEGDDATSLNEELRMKNEESTVNEIYNLAGQRISKMQKGINIVGGKKVLR